MNRYLQIPILLIVLAACDNVRHKPEIVETKDTLTEKKAIIDSDFYKEFRAWVNDTLKLINKEEKQPQDDAFLFMDIIQSPDSNELIFNTGYEVVIPSKNYSQKAKDIISLFKQYDEMPKNGHRIIFCELYEYHPSMIPELKREVYSYYDNIRVYPALKGKVTYPIHHKNWIEYSYIRGRLSGKKEYIDNREVASYSFIWQNDTLIKTKH